MVSLLIILCLIEVEYAWGQTDTDTKIFNVFPIYSDLLQQTTEQFDTKNKNWENIYSKSTE